MLSFDLDSLLSTYPPWLREEYFLVKLDLRPRSPLLLQVDWLISWDLCPQLSRPPQLISGDFMASIDLCTRISYPEDTSMPSLSKNCRRRYEDRNKNGWSYKTNILYFDPPTLWIILSPPPDLLVWCNVVRVFWCYLFCCCYQNATQWSSAHWFFILADRVYIHIKLKIVCNSPLLWIEGKKILSMIKIIDVQ